ncbi:MAG TPA: OsmC family protein, partial [Roseiflexaceae bacterium]
MADVIVHSMGNLRQEIDAGSHTFYADEPAEAGVVAAGPNPYELLLGALGACTSMTLLLYARRKGWPIEDVEVRLSHSRDYARDCAECDERTTKLDVIERRIVLRGQLDEAQRTRLLEIAEKCPVHRTLTGRIKVNDRLEAEVHS